MNTDAAMAGPFKPSYKPTTKTTPVRVSIRPKTTVMHVFEKLSVLTDEEMWHHGGTIMDKTRSEITDTLTPHEIQDFLYHLQAYEGEPSYSEAAGQVVGQLVENSLRGGHHEFHFDMRGLKPLKNCCTKINQDSQDLTIIVRGNAGYGFGCGAKGTFYMEDAGQGAFSHASGIFAIKKANEVLGMDARGKFYLEEGHDSIGVCVGLVNGIQEFYVKSVGARCGLGPNRYGMGSNTCKVYVLNHIGAIPPVTQGEPATYYSHRHDILEPLEIPAKHKIILPPDEWNAKWQEAEDVFAELNRRLGLK